MTLDLAGDQPTETMPAATQETICTLITVDAVPVRLTERDDGSLVIQPGRWSHSGITRNPLILDRFQKRAMIEALMEGRA
jgi:hypothetical protein